MTAARLAVPGAAWSRRSSGCVAQPCQTGRCARASNRSIARIASVPSRYWCTSTSLPTQPPPQRQPPRNSTGYGLMSVRATASGVTSTARSARARSRSKRRPLSSSSARIGSCTRWTLSGLRAAGCVCGNPPKDWKSAKFDWRSKPASVFSVAQAPSPTAATRSVSGARRRMASRREARMAGHPSACAGAGGTQRPDWRRRASPQGRRRPTVGILYAPGAARAPGACPIRALGGWSSSCKTPEQGRGRASGSGGTWRRRRN